MELRFGKAGAGLVEPSVARRLEKQTPELVFIEQKLPTEFKVIGDGITLKKNNLTLTAEVTKVIEQLKKEGILQQLEAKWQIDGGA
jgi:ABC-type amino acid transport substrate-binding protein